MNVAGASGRAPAIRLELAAAGFWRRLAAALVDTILLTIVLVALFVLVFVTSGITAPGPLSDLSDATFALLILVVAIGEAILAWLYSALMESSGWQATLGKRLLGLRVTDLGGRRISFLRATARYAGRASVFLTLGVGFLVIVLPGRRQGLHDLVAGTVVLRSRQQPAPDPVPSPAQPAVPVSPGGWQWQPVAPRAYWPIPPAGAQARPRGWRRAFGFGVAALFVGGSLAFIVLTEARVASAGPFLAAGAAIAVGVVAALASLRWRIPQRRAWSAAAAAAFESVREQGEVLQADSYVYIGLRPWVLDLVLANWIVRAILPQGVLVVTDRRLLLFGKDLVRGALDRLERAEDLAGVSVRVYSPGLFRPRLVLASQGRPDLQVTFPWAWQSNAAEIVAAIERREPATGPSRP